MLEDKNTYITETGALMSAHDYSFLSADQKERCKVYKMEHAKEDRPDFESTLDQYILANIGLSLNSPDLTPMDKGECKYMLRQMHKDYVVPMSKQLQERDAKIAELEKSNENFKTCMIAAAEEIMRHWKDHCDEDGYGPSNLMHRLEKGIPAQYGYTAGAFEKMEAEITRLKSELDKAMELLDESIGYFESNQSSKSKIREIKTFLKKIK